MRSSKNNFTTSVNPKFDIGNINFIDRYLPTPSHATFIKNIMKSFQNETNMNSHIIIGPYGSGKSLAATIMADIFSGNINEREIQKLANKFVDVDQDIYSSINSSVQNEYKYIPVVLSGYEGPFANAIINAIMRELTARDISIDFNSASKNIEDTVTLWESEYKSTFNRFKTLLKDKKTTLRKWLMAIRHNDNDELIWFKNVYSSLTAGASFQVSYDGIFLESITKIIKELLVQNFKLFVIYDEFGRFLQAQEPSLLFKTMQDLQDLAELSNRSKGNMQLLLISHKNMGHYISSIDSQDKSEFQRIEKRFSTYFIDSDKATFYRIAQLYTKNLQEERMLLNFEDHLSKTILRKYNLFAELNHQEVERLIVEGAYPLHPISLFLIPRLSSVFGQNERTLFTFLESEDTGGLLNHLMTNKTEPYLPHHLFDYFFSGDIKEFLADDLYAPLRTLAKILSGKKISKNNSHETRVLKLITLWELANASSVIKLNEELIAYATNLTVEEISKVLENLTQMKLVRYNRIISKWELSQGSAAVVEDLIEEERVDLVINENTRLEYFTKVLDNKYFLATDYNNEKNITRFFKVIPILTSEYEFAIKSLSNQVDGYVVYLLNNSDGEFDFSHQSFENYHTPIVVAYQPKSYKTIKAQIDRLILLEKLLVNKKVLAEYDQLEEEVSVLIEEAKFELKKFSNLFEQFDRDTKWISNKGIIEIESGIDLENYISVEMYECYNLTPEIRNDSINRRKLNSMQNKAIRKVTDNIIDNPFLPDIGIEGQGPDYLIYATVFKNNGIDFDSLDNIQEVSLRSLRENTLNYIKENPKGNVQDLKQIFTNKPYGIREPLIPLLFVGLVRDYWDQLIFFRNDMFVTSIDAEKIYGIFNEAEHYNYHFHNYDQDFLKYTNKLEKMFQEHMSEYVKDQTPVIKASSALLGWLRSLPRHTQITERLDEDIVLFKQLIRQVEVSPLLKLTTIKETFTIDDTEKIKKHLENHYSHLKEVVRSHVLNIFNVLNEKELQNKLNNYEAHQLKSNPLLANLQPLDSSWIEDFTSKYTGIELKNWADTTFDLFINQVQNDYKNIDSQLLSEDSIVLQVGETSKVIKEVPLSTKAKTIYENVNRTITNAGRSVPREEIEYLVYQLVRNYIK